MNFGLNVLDFGADPSGRDDCAAAFRAAQEALSGFSAREGGRVQVPRGRYRFASPLDLIKQVVLEGEAGGMGDYPASTLVFDEGVPGVRMLYGRRQEDLSGVGSVVQHLGIVTRAGGTDPGIHGVVLMAHGQLLHSYVEGFSGNNVHVEGAVPDSNANHWHLRHVRSYRAGHHGVYVGGHDANGGSAYDVRGTYCNEWGFLDEAALANLYVDCKTDQNGQAHLDAGDDRPGGFCTRGTASHIFLGCYVEGDQGPSRLSEPTTWIPGTMGTKLIGGQRLGYGDFRALMRNQDPDQIMLLLQATGVFDPETQTWGPQRANLLEAIDLFSRRGFCLGPSAQVGIGAKNPFAQGVGGPQQESPGSLADLFAYVSGFPHLRFGVGQLGWIAHLVAHEDGLAYGDGRLTVETCGPGGVRQQAMHWKNGRTGVGLATTPQSTFEVGGSAAGPIRRVSRDVTLTDADGTVGVDTTDGPVKVWLPLAASCRGRRYTIRHLGGGFPGALMVQADQDRLIGPSVVSEARTTRLQSNGCEPGGEFGEWWVL